MSDLEAIRTSLNQYLSPAEAAQFFRSLGYPVTQPPLPCDNVLDEMPLRAREAVGSLNQIFQSEGEPPFRIFHVELRHPSIRRADIRCFLEAFYQRYPLGENLFVFSPEGRCDELIFVSPRRLPDPRDRQKVRLWLRILPVRRAQPYCTDLEVLDCIRADGLQDPRAIWERHEEAFSVQRVTEQFFRDYSRVFREVQHVLRRSHEENGPDWARDYTHLMLNRILFLYFIARQGWLRGPDGNPNRDFMRHFWDAYRETGARDTFHQDWLDILFFEVFNHRCQTRGASLNRFPGWLIRSLSQAPPLNGGLYSRRTGLDDRLHQPVPDALFALLFEQWIDGTRPGLFERYHFTVVESGRLDDEVAVDPEVLGVVCERLVNATFEGEDEGIREAAGIFYTPRLEIDLMCRLALVDWLANQLGGQHQDLLYHWVFALSEEDREEAEHRITRAGLWETLDARLKRVRVCDPACGSGSFLVGMMLVLDELQARCGQALGQSETLYERRKRILQDQLYGVDVMEWAVRVAELRLWLQLVVETDPKGWETKACPLLPNLNLKLRPGDSLLQTLGDLDLSHFRRGELSIPPHLKDRLTQLKGKKRRFFQGEESDLTGEMLRKEEWDLFRDLLEHRIYDLQNRLAGKRNQVQSLHVQASLSGMPAPPPDENLRRRLDEEVGELEKQLEYFQRVRDALTPDTPPPFVWDLAFVEVFEADEPGFDIVIGNPPYVRQEKIRDYLGRFDRQEYLCRLNEGLRAIYPTFMGKTRRISGRADYYVYFYLHALSLLARRGTLCFITSNSWLDVDFGRDLQDFFLRFGHLKMVIDNRANRSFAQADVNTVIVLAGPPEHQHPLSEEEMKARPVRFVVFQVPFEEAIHPAVFAEIGDTSLYEPLASCRVLRRPEFRAILQDQWSLYQEGLADTEEEGKGDQSTLPWKQTRPMVSRPCAGSKWGGKYLRAPDIFFTILEKGKGKLVRLGDIARVRRGFTTGANEFFYLEPVEMTVREVAELREQDPMAPIRVRNGAGWEGEIEAAWLRPVIKSPREIKTLRVRLEDLRHLVWMKPDNSKGVANPGDGVAFTLACPLASAYIEWGASQGYPDRPTCTSRQWWWDVGAREVGHALCMMSYNDRHPFWVNGVALCDARLYDVYITRDVNPIVVIALLNTILVPMFIELGGRFNLGEGALDFKVYEAAALPLLRHEVLSFADSQRLLDAFHRLCERPISDIFQELGFRLCQRRECQHPEHPYEHVRPETLTLEQVQRASPDRFELDRVVFDVLGLRDAERLEVYRAVVHLVRDRLVKARSV